MSKDHLSQFIDAYLEGLRSQQVLEESLELLRRKVKVISIKSKDMLIIPGEVCRHIYLVVQGGFVCRYIHEKTGAAKTINFYLEDLHPIMACLDSYFTQVPTNCELKAISNSLVLALPKETVDLIRGTDSAFAAFYHEVVMTAMMEENELKTKLIAYSSKEKYDFIIERMPSVSRKVPSKYIAEFCGVSAEWLSKLKKQV
ncbi:MAG: hypothetical protein AAF399_05825 [Bacteroidota bacterium]